jgi:hypothetical protein
MPDARRSLKSRGRTAACLLLFATFFAVAPLRAQDEQLAAPPASPAFLSRFDFELSAAALAYDDQRFCWDAHWRGEVDIVDWGGGRISFLGDYQTLLGNEFRPFDPYQSNYILDVSGSLRAGRVELVAVFHHLSRHLGDRQKRRPDNTDLPVAYNSVNGRVLYRAQRRDTTVHIRGELGRAIAYAYVDYTWLGSGEATVRHAVHPALELYGRGMGQFIVVRPEIAGRDRQLGGRAEGGVRISGISGTLDFFGGYERVIDADPLDRIARQWAFVGFRLSNR